MHRVNTDMYNAVCEEDLFKMGRYMKAGFDINQPYKDASSYGASTACTLLYYAVQEFKYWAVKFLLDNGADVNIANEDGKTPLHLIVSNRRIRLPRRLGPKWHTDKFEKMGDPLEIARTLIEAGAQLDVKTPHRHRTPLEDSLHNPDMVELLLKSGCKIHETFHGESILLVEAAVEGGMKVVNLLIDAGVDPELRDSEEGHNALQAAEHFNVTKAIPILKEEKLGRIQAAHDAHEAFAMGAHKRLGENSSILPLEDGVVDIILNALKHLNGLK
jgi:ankyrin repeat protein